MKKSLFGILLMAIVIPFMSSCASSNKVQDLFSRSFKIKRAPQQQFYDLTKGVQINVVPSQPMGMMDEKIIHLSSSRVPVGPTIQYIRTMGIREKNVKEDYTLTLSINKIDWRQTSTTSIDVNISVKLVNTSGEILYSQEAETSGIIFSPSGISDVYTQALEQIDWTRIASFLRVEKLAKDEPTKQVEGLGTTALEQTIVRWEVNSRPQGADIFWRVVSKTPDVKSTNNKYLTTTPYEATKSLDIKGLTYQTAGDVRIILRCEKEGYFSQEKEFNARMVIDQEEISAFFKLVKEDNQ